MLVIVHGRMRGSSSSDISSVWDVSYSDFLCYCLESLGKIGDNRCYESWSYWSFGTPQSGDSDHHPVVAVAPGVPDEDMQPFANTVPDATVFEDPHHVLQHVDVVVINPPFHANARWIIAALDAGVPVLAEKPLAITELRLCAGASSVEKSATPLTAMLDIRYRPAFQAAWRAVRAGAIGDVRLVTAQKSYRLGRRPDFYTNRATYGGTIPWVGAHSIDLLRWFSGQEFQHVTALHSTIGNDGHGDLEVSTHCQFLLDNGVIAQH